MTATGAAALVGAEGVSIASKEKKNNKIRPLFSEKEADQKTSRQIGAQFTLTKKGLRNISVSSLFGFMPSSVKAQ